MPSPAIRYDRQQCTTRSKTIIRMNIDAHSRIALVTLVLTHLPNLEMPKVVPLRSSTELYLLSLPVMMALGCFCQDTILRLALVTHHLSGLAMYRPTSL
jgi:hypothetical protein